MDTTKLLQNKNAIIAILRGVSPEEVLEVASIIVNEGISILEVPLNSPSAIQSIRLLVENLGDTCLVGAGTVTTEEEARQVVEAGAKLIVTPNYNHDVIQVAIVSGCVIASGVLTPTEALNAIRSGATALKFFPMNVIGVSGYKAIRSILPSNTRCFAVGGISPTAESVNPLLDAGVDGLGLGASLYNPCMSYEQIKESARAFVSLLKK